jgi:hypothetical protein
MSLEQTNTVDAIGTADDRVLLTIIDSLNWDNETLHLTLLQEKLNAYLRFIESGEIDKVYPSAVGRARVISVIARYEPTTSGFEFLKNAQASIGRAGFEFMFEIREK